MLHDRIRKLSFSLLFWNLNELVQYFKENQFFFDRVLKKEFKYVPPPSAQNDVPGPDGITEAMIDFSWDRDVAISVGDLLRSHQNFYTNVSEKACKINWKEPDKALTKVYPREAGNDDVSEPGSFFNLFEHEGDPHDVSLSCAISLC
jgi:template-activating factor I